MIATALDRLAAPPSSKLLGWHLLDARPGEGGVRSPLDRPADLPDLRGGLRPPRSPGGLQGQEVEVPGLRLAEAPRNRQRSFCCGAGGARMWMEERIGTRVNTTRTTELLGTGAAEVP